MKARKIIHEGLYMLMYSRIQWLINYITGNKNLNLIHFSHPDLYSLTSTFTLTHYLFLLLYIWVKIFTVSVKMSNVYSTSNSSSTPTNACTGLSHLVCLYAHGENCGYKNERLTNNFVGIFNQYSQGVKTLELLEEGQKSISKECCHPN